MHRSLTKEVQAAAQVGDVNGVLAAIRHASILCYPSELVKSYATSALSDYYAANHCSTMQVARFAKDMLIGLGLGAGPSSGEDRDYFCDLGLHPNRTSLQEFVSVLSAKATKPKHDPSARIGGLEENEKTSIDTNLTPIPEWLTEAERRGLFDTTFYQSTNPDLPEGSSVYEHFASTASLEWDRDPSQYFSISQYYANYPDVKASGMNALEHFVRYGKDRNRFPSNKIIHELQGLERSVDLEFITLPNSFSLESKSIAICLHIHYPESLVELLPTLIPTQQYADLIISTTSEANKVQVESLLASVSAVRARVILYAENKGRDIGAYYCATQDMLRGYDYACKIHAKKSPHLGDFGLRWAKYLIRATIGSRSLIERAVWILEKNPQIGILAPVPFRNTSDHSWDANYEIASRLCSSLGLASPHEAQPAGLRYPSATVFWHRPAALDIAAKTVAPNMFPNEPLATDGTTAHAMERLMPAIAYTNGFSTLFYHAPSTALAHTKEWEIKRWLECCKDESPIIVFGHDASNSGAPRTALALQRTLAAKTRSGCLVVLLGGGVLVDEFKGQGQTIVLENGIVEEHISAVFKYTITRCTIITNTVVCASIGRIAKEHGHIHISLVHEHASTGYWDRDSFKNALDAHCCVFPGPRMKEAALNFSGLVRDANIAIMPQGLYRDSFPEVPLSASAKSVRDELGIEANALIVLGCGTIEQRKGVDLFVDVARFFGERYSALQNESPVYFLWIGGLPASEGGEREWAHQLIKSTSKQGQPNIIFAGSCIRSDRYFAAADLFFLSSRFDPFPGVVLEAMASGMPIVCIKGTTDVDSAFIDNVGGYSLEYDKETISKQIARILASRSRPLREQMGEANKMKVASKFSITSYTDKLVTYARLASRGIIDAQAMSSSNGRINPLVSVVVPAYRTKVVYLQQLVESLIRQEYANWELCISCASLPTETEIYLSTMALAHPRIKARYIEGELGISENTNIAISQAEGEYVVFCDHDDVIPPFCIRRLIESHIKEGHDFVFSAEGKVDKSGLRYYAPVYKPGFCESHLMRNNYITHIVSVRRSLIDEVGGLNSSFDGAQDYDFILRATRRAKSIGYIDEVLYHWRVFEDSTASGDSSAKPYAVEAGRRALLEYIKSCGHVNSEVVHGEIAFTYEVIHP